MSVWHAVEAAARRHAERVAIEVLRGGAVERWTYRDLLTQSLHCAGALLAAGVRRGDRCALLADNDARWCAAYFGVLAAGGVVVPLETSLPAAELSTLLHETTPRVVVVSDRLTPVARIAVEAGPDVRLVPLQPSGVVSVPHALPAAADSAVVLFTAGTASKRKGVLLSHANLLAACEASSRIIAASEHDTVLAALPLCDAFAQVTTLLLPLSAGARVVFPETDDDTGCLQALSQRRVTLVPCDPHFLTTTHVGIFRNVAGRPFLSRLLFRTLLALNIRLRRVGLDGGRVFFNRVHAMLGRRVRLFMTGGARLEPKIGRDLHALGFTVLKQYGLTETTGTATLARHGDGGFDTVGRALPGLEIRLLEPDTPHEDGEIAIRGPVVMQGYLNRPGETAAVIRDGWFRTGDLGRLDDAGRLTVTGRLSDRVVLRSDLVVNAEHIERQYRTSPFIKEMCVVGAVGGEPPSLHLHAVVVPNMALLRKRQIVNAGDLLRFEMEGQSIHLPPHSRVSSYDVSFEPLPRTARGALKRHEVEQWLREKSRAAGAAAGNDVVDWADDAHAQHAAAVIRRVAGSRRVDRASNLELDLGLDSVGRVELIAELEARFGTRVPSGRVHELLTAGELIEAVRRPDAPQVEAAREVSWRTILRTPPTDPVLRRLLARRFVVPWVLFLAFRAARLILPRVDVQGVEHLPDVGPYIVAPNHQSYLDPFFICSVLPHRVFRQLFIVGASEYFESPATAWMARQLNLVPVDPDAQLIPAMQAAAYGLSHDKILMLFPEGERSIDGTVKRFKKGAAILGHHLEVPIVPVAIRGVYELWPRNRPFNWRLLRPWSRHVVRLSFDAPVAITTADSGKAAAMIRDRVAAMWATLAAHEERDRRDLRSSGDAPEH